MRCIKLLRLGVLTLVSIYSDKKGMTSGVWIAVFISLISVATAAERGQPLPPERLNELIVCLRAEFAAAANPDERQRAFSRLVSSVNESADFSKYINSPDSGSVNVSDPFALYMQGVDAGSNQRDPFGMDVSLLVFRGDPGSLKLNEIPTQRFDGHYVTKDAMHGESWTREQIAQTKNLSLKALYDEFEDQEGRAENIGKYTKQDLKPIATHFVLLVRGEPVARIQVQISSDHAVELNYEENFPRVPKLDPPGERRAEVGRNGMVRASRRTPEVQQIIEEGGGEEHLRDLMFQKVFSWINSDVQLQQVRFHVNGAVRRNWSRAFKPVKFDDELKLQDNPSPAKVEWLITFSRPNLLRLEEAMMAKTLVDNVTRIRKDTVSYPPTRKGGNSVQFYFRANEIPLLERLGILKFGHLGEGHLQDSHDTKTMTLRVEQSKMADFEAYLRTKLLQTSK